MHVSIESTWCDSWEFACSKKQTKGKPRTSSITSLCETYEAPFYYLTVSIENWRQWKIVKEGTNQITSNDHPFNCPIICTDIYYAILFTDTSNNAWYN